jgi:hypothetical protein
MKQEGDTLLDSYKSDFEDWRIEEFIKVDRTLQKEMIRILEQGGITVQEGRSHAEKLASLTVQADRASREPSLLTVPHQARFQPSSPVRPSIEQQARFARVLPEHLHPKHAPYGTQYRGPSGIGQPQLGVRSVYEFNTYPAPLHTTPEYPARLATPAPVQNFPPTRPIYSVHLEPAKLVSFQKAWRKDRNYTGKPYDILYDKARMFIQTSKISGNTAWYCSSAISSRLHVWINIRALSYRISYGFPV